MTEAQLERESQRSESEARDIIHDIERLNTFPESKKSRWVWELLQNAKDVANEDGVDVTYKLEDDTVTVSHNGMPFETKHLLAILYKTSTKSLGGEDGTTGKYGTGFVTTHILSKKVTISGVHKNEKGKREFNLEIDRTSAALEETKALTEMQKSLSETFKKIDEISSISSSENNTSNLNSFIYITSPNSRKYAQEGLLELEKNIEFTLLANRREKKKINSVTIINNGDVKTYTINPTISKIEGLNFIQIEDKTGIIYKETDNILLGVPVLEREDKYEILSIEGKSVLYKEFPLIGTEMFNLPVFIQHKQFKPTEERDGVRTKKDSEEILDSTADNNRDCFVDFIKEYIPFLKSLIDAESFGLHHIVLSGLPEDCSKYHNIKWYTNNIQTPIRNLLYQKPILKNVTGQLIKIEEANFPTKDLADDAELYSIFSVLIPNKISHKECLKEWNKAIHQDLESWPDVMTVNLEELLKQLPNIVDLNDINSYLNLRKIYDYLVSKKLTLGEEIPIYANEERAFKIRDEVSLYPKISEEMKIISKQLGRNLDAEFLNKELGEIEGVKPFDLEDFYKRLNNEFISPLQPEKATEEQVSAILRINSLFKSDKASKRENWLSIIKEILPEKTHEKSIIFVDYENYYQPAELWTAKYICWLIQKEVTIIQFSNNYFQGNIEVTYGWLNKFLNYIFQSREDIKNFLSKYNVLPAQDDRFVSDSESLFQENNPNYFEESLKEIVQKFCSQNPKSFLLKNQVIIEGFRKVDVEIITKPIDKLFENENIQSKVSKGGELYDVFLEVNNWFEKHSDASSYLKTFSSKRDMLYVNSLGEGFGKQIMALKDSGKSMEDIAELAKINLTAKEMQQLEKVANELGTSELLKKAEEMIILKNQRLKWKQIGTSAEKAFKKVFEGLEMDIVLSNPDVGKDFELLLKSKNYSIEIKNVIEGKEIVRMSILQGRTAVLEKEHYALCVMTRPNDEIEINEEYFIEHSKFVIDIGFQIGDKIRKWDEGLISLSQDDNIKVNLDSKTETVYINRTIWKEGITFSDFIKVIETLFTNESI